AALLIAAQNGPPALRRLAIAILVCEFGIVALGQINYFFWQLPLPGTYAELAHAPLWAPFFVLALMIGAILLDRRIAGLGEFPPRRRSRILQGAMHRRHWAYAVLFIAAVGAYALLR